MLDPHTAAELSLDEIHALVDALLDAHGCVDPGAARSPCSTVARDCVDGWEHDRRPTCRRMWSGFSADEQERLADIADWLLQHKHWEAAHGFELDDDDPARRSRSRRALLVLELGTEYYREVSAIIVYPTTILSRGTYAGPVRRDGDATAWCRCWARRTITAARSSSRGTRRGTCARESRPRPQRGVPRVRPQDRHARRHARRHSPAPEGSGGDDGSRCAPRCTQSLRDGAERSPLDPYGGTNPAEFFAVATETFFDAPVVLGQHEPGLYEVLQQTSTPKTPPPAPNPRTLPTVRRKTCALRLFSAHHVG